MIPSSGNKRRSVVVTGLGVVNAVANSTAAFEDALRRGVSGVVSLPEFDSSRWHSSLAAPAVSFDPFLLLSRRDIRGADRTSRLALCAAAEAVSRSSLRRFGSTAAVVLGTTLGGMNAGVKFYGALTDGHVRVRCLHDFPMHSAADRIAAHWGVSGPVVAVSTACAAGTHAVGLATDMIRGGLVDAAIAGGVDPLSQFTHAGFGVLGLLTSDAVRPFDLNRSGLVLGEGAGFVVLEAAECAAKRNATVLAEIAGFGITSDAHHMTAPEADGEGAARAITLALHDAELHPSEVDYINAHGTGTRKNDAAEAKAIMRALGPAARKVPVSSTKSMIGHTLGAAGAIELIATILAMRGRFLPPTINFRTADSDCLLDCVPNESRVATVRVALSNSFGFGGNNGCIAVLAADA
jgi:3-oxoacyl-[acyl-carrier-protein] synthase II